jgi:hypothetical protein
MQSDNIFEIEINSIWLNNQDLKNEWQNHFKSYQDLFYGQCYRFNSGLNMSNQSIPFKKLKTSGLDDGLWLAVNTKLNASEVLIVHIHNHTQMPASIYNNRRFISEGFNTYFVIRQSYDQKLESPFNDCFKDVSHFQIDRTIINYLKSRKRIVIVNCRV